MLARRLASDGFSIRQCHADRFFTSTGSLLPELGHFGVVMPGPLAKVLGADRCDRLGNIRNAFERDIPPSGAFLRWLISNPERLDLAVRYRGQRENLCRTHRRQAPYGYLLVNWRQGMRHCPSWTGSVLTAPGGSGGPLKVSRPSTACLKRKRFWSSSRASARRAFHPRRIGFPVETRSFAIWRLPARWRATPRSTLSCFAPNSAWNYPKPYGAKACHTFRRPRSTS